MDTAAQEGRPVAGERWRNPMDTVTEPHGYSGTLAHGSDPKRVQMWLNFVPKIGPKDLPGPVVPFFGPRIGTALLA